MILDRCDRILAHIENQLAIALDPYGALLELAVTTEDDPKRARGWGLAAVQPTDGHLMIAL